LKFVNSHYDKILLIIAILTSSLFFTFQLLDDTDHKTKFLSLNNHSLIIDEIDGVETVSFSKKTKLMPTNQVIFLSQDTDLKKVLSVDKVIFPRKSKLEIKLNNDDFVSGKLLNATSLVLSKSWKNARTPIVIETENGVKNIYTKDINHIYGSQKVVFEQDINFINDSGWIPLIYQDKNIEMMDNNITQKVRWTTNFSEENSSIYDLFTPPLIYLVDGSLTTSIPSSNDDAVEEEPFGVSLLSFKKEIYRFKMSGWIGNTPYFEDLKTQISSERNARNRVETNVPYKLNPSYKPGLPSLIKTTPEDAEKLLLVEFFTVQQVPNKKTGGLKPVGRAMVKDYSIGGKSFEINSLMNEVYSGQFSIQLKFELPSTSPLEIEISEKDEGKEIIFADRSYEIISIDSVNKTITISKNDPRTAKISTVTLN